MEEGCAGGGGVLRGIVGMEGEVGWFVLVMVKRAG